MAGATPGFGAPSALGGAPAFATASAFGTSSGFGKVAAFSRARTFGGLSRAVLCFCLFAGGSSATPAFGASSQLGGGAPSFGAAPAPALADTPASPFGGGCTASPFGAAAPAASPFGASNLALHCVPGAMTLKVSPFVRVAGSAAAPAFGAPSALGGAPAFGAPSPSGGSAFGAPSQLGCTPAFGTCAYSAVLHAPSLKHSRRVSFLFACRRRWCLWRCSRWWWVWCRPRCRWVCELCCSSWRQWVWSFGTGRQRCTAVVVWGTSLRPTSTKPWGACWSSFRNSVVSIRNLEGTAIVSVIAIQGTCPWVPCRSA